MPSPSLRNLALGELTDNPPALTALLAEGETLFVEHKSGIASGEGFQIAKAAASFANTLSGWILVGVDPKGRPIPGWQPPPGGFVDTVRQRLEGQLDPIPSIAATVLRHEEHSIGVIRVYESADTPHILLSDGSIVVREPAQDAKLRKRGKYEATPIRSHYELAQLTQRGRQAEEAAEQRLEEGRMPWVEEALRFRWDMAATDSGVFRMVLGDPPALILRATPLTMNGRWSDWASSETGVAAARRLAEGLLDDEIEADDPMPHPAGVALTARQRAHTPWVPGGNRSVSEISTAVLDAGGMIGLRLGTTFGKETVSSTIGGASETAMSLRPLRLASSITRQTPSPPPSNSVALPSVPSGLVSASSIAWTLKTPTPELHLASCPPAVPLPSTGRMTRSSGKRSPIGGRWSSYEPLAWPGGNEHELFGS